MLTLGIVSAVVCPHCSWHMRQLIDRCVFEIKCSFMYMRTFNDTTYSYILSTLQGLEVWPSGNALVSQQVLYARPG